MTNQFLGLITVSLWGFIWAHAHILGSVILATLSLYLRQNHHLNCPFEYVLHFPLESSMHCHPNRSYCHFQSRVKALFYQVRFPHLTQGGVAALFEEPEWPHFHSLTVATPIFCSPPIFVPIKFYFLFYSFAWIFTTEGKFLFLLKKKMLF